MLLCGIDPGFRGAIAFLRDGALDFVMSMPVRTERVLLRKAKSWNRTDYDWVGIADVLRRNRPDLVVIERAWARAGEGVTNSFRSGTGYGGLIATLSVLELPYELVVPGVWKNALGLRGGDKEASRLLAIDLMPEGRAIFARKMDHGRAEAALIALWKARYEHTRLEL